MLASNTSTRQVCKLKRPSDIDIGRSARDNMARAPKTPRKGQRSPNRTPSPKHARKAVLDRSPTKQLQGSSWITPTNGMIPSGPDCPCFRECMKRFNSHTLTHSNRYGIAGEFLRRSTRIFARNTKAKRVLVRNGRITVVSGQGIVRTQDTQRMGVVCLSC